MPTEPLVTDFWVISINQISIQDNTYENVVYDITAILF